LQNKKKTKNWNIWTHYINGRKCG